MINFTSANYLYTYDKYLSTFDVGFYFFNLNTYRT